MPEINPVIATLRQHDTPTVWNALTRLRGHSTQGLTIGPIAASDSAMRMVGYAATARMTSDAPVAMSAEEKDAIRFAYYRMVGAAPAPRIVVMQDIGERRGLGSIWGEVNAAIHQGLGCAGVVTDGAMRDLDALHGFPILAGSICLGNGFTQLRDIGGEVEVFGLRVRPGDLIHADRHGAMTIPAEHVAALPAVIETVLTQEKRIIATTRAPGFDAEAMIEAWRKGWR
ncbi:RraA family protein [Falsiroseomonas sp. HW251]|uniref:RraA family protein n=1 Tax=Falsiroseomonas sp. HW251 TaxID=3390998 RepID=UPI003D31F6B8